VVAQLAKNVNMRYFSNNFFSSSVLSLMDAEYVKKKKRYSRGFIELVLKWTNDIFNCSCKENPYCECGRLNLESIVLNLRTDKGFSVSQIHNYLREYYKILIFRGDLIDYFENLIYSLESVKNLISSFKNLEKTYQKELERIPILMEKIKGSY
jgi:superfamily II helicase